MESHYQGTLHPRDLIFVTSNARYGSLLVMMRPHIILSVAMGTIFMKKTVIELCKKAEAPGSTGVDLVNVQDTQKFTRHQ
eukprot:10284767-Ditylum_brightwellii.AAC.1